MKVKVGQIWSAPPGSKCLGWKVTHVYASLLPGKENAFITALKTYVLEGVTYAYHDRMATYDIGGPIATGWTLIEDR